MALLRLIKQQLGLSVTPANNFTITAEADNGTMKIARGNPGETTQDVMTVDAAGKVTFPQNAQTWQTLNASRALATPYTNNTGQAIKLYIRYSSTTATSLYVDIGGMQFASMPQLTIGQPIVLQVEVPAGVTYTVTIGSGTPTQLDWRELR